MSEPVSGVCCKTHNAVAPMPRKSIPADTLRSLSRLNPLLSMTHIVFEWFLSFAMVFAFIWSDHSWLLYIVAVPFIGGRQQALFFLLHEGAHFRLLRQAKWNNAVSEILLATPLFVINIDKYRAAHFEHHRYLNTDDDPDWAAKRTPAWQFPKSRWAMLATLLKPWPMAKSAVNRPEQVRKTQITLPRIFFYLTSMLLLTVYSFWLEFVLLWLVPMFTWWPIARRVTTISDHYALAYDSFYTSSRVTYPSFLTRIFIAPKNSGYHLDHHLYPSVPFFNLPRLHDCLMKQPQYREKAHVSRSYRGVIREAIIS